MCNDSNLYFDKKLNKIKLNLGLIVFPSQLILKNVDSLLYVDTDILFLRPVDDIWSFLRKFNSTQIAAMAPEHEEPRIGWYNRFARHPYYGLTGINSGVMLMNMTRIRRKYFKVCLVPLLCFFVGLHLIILLLFEICVGQSFSKSFSWNTVVKVHFVLKWYLVFF